MKMNHEKIRDLLELYALDTLDLDERAEVEQHLAICRECSQKAASFKQITSNFPAALAIAAPMSPPPALKQRLLDTIDPKPSESKLTKQPIWRRARMGLDVAALVLLILAGVWIAQLHTAVAEERELRIDLEGQTELIFEVIDSNDTSRMVLLPPNFDPELDAFPPYGKVFVRADLPYVVAMTGRIPEAPIGQVYNLWLFTDGTPELVGTMTVNEDGFGSLVYDSGVTGPIYDYARLIRQSVNSHTTDGAPILTTRLASQ